MKRFVLASGQKIASALSHLLPSFIERLFYLIPYWVFKTFNKRPNRMIWYRNSMAFDDLVFGHSDIDLTCYSEEPLNFEEGKSLLRSLKRLRVIFPHLGEMALYDKSSLECFIDLANPIELSRDPQLVQTIEGYKGLHTVENHHRHVFALNWLRNDFHKWHKNFSSRRKKIARFFKLLNLKKAPEEVSNPQQLVQVLHEECWTELKNDENFAVLIEEVLKLNLHGLNAREKELSLNQFYKEKVKLRVHFMLCFPQLWLGPALVHNNLTADLKEFSSASGSLKAIFREQIRWEVWGLYGQYMREGGNLNFYIHLDELVKVISSLPGDWSQELKGLQSMKETDPSSSEISSQKEVHYASQ